MQISESLSLSVEVVWPALPEAATASPALQESYRFPTELTPTADTPAALDLQSLGSGMYTFTLSPSNDTARRTRGSFSAQVAVSTAKCAPGFVPVLVTDAAKEDPDVVAWQVEGGVWHARCVMPPRTDLNEPTLVRTGYW